MKPEQQKNLLFILIPSTILVVAWIGFGIYNKSVTSTISSQQQISILPIAPSFETGVFEALKNRKVIQPYLTADAALPISPTPTLQSASNSSTLTVSPSQQSSSSAEGGSL